MRLAELFLQIEAAAGHPSFNGGDFPLQGAALAGAELRTKLFRNKIRPLP